MFWGKTDKPIYIYRFIYIYAIYQRKRKGMMMSCTELSHFSCFQLFANPMQTPKQGDCVRVKGVANMNIKFEKNVNQEKVVKAAMVN